MLHATKFRAQHNIGHSGAALVVSPVEPHTIAAVKQKNLNIIIIVMMVAIMIVIITIFIIILYFLSLG